MNAFTHLMAHGSYTKAHQDFTDKHILQWHLAPRDILNDRGEVIGVRYKGEMYKTRLSLPSDMIGGQPIYNLHGNGWRKPGYSDLILRDGKVINLHSYNSDDHIDSWEITNGAKGWNGHTRHFCLIGGMSDNGIGWKENYTELQYIAMEAYIRATIRNHPEVKLIGHNQVSMKDCPGFNVPIWCRKRGIELDNLDFHNYGGNTHFRFLND